MSRQIGDDITGVIPADDRWRIVTNCAADCRVRVRADAASIVRGIGVHKPRHDLRHAAGT
jgi:hypothetical protein